MSAREMERCECQVGHTGPLVVLVDARCSAGCEGDPKAAAAVICHCCGRVHWLPFAAVAGCFRDEVGCDACGAQALLVLEPLAACAGAGT